MTASNPVHSPQPNHVPTPPHTENSLDLSGLPFPTSQRNWKAIKKSSQLPITCFKHTTCLHRTPSSLFLLNLASFFLENVKSSAYVLSPFPEKPYPVNYLLSSIFYLSLPASLLVIQIRSTLFAPYFHLLITALSLLYFSWPHF